MITKLFELARNNKKGYPFSAVLYYKEKAFWAVNTVIQDNDPTAHAEINAIKQACKKFRTPNLTGAILVSSGEPCPMCLTACAWAGIKDIWFLEDYKVANDKGYSFDRDAVYFNQHWKLGLRVEKMRY